MFLYLLFMLPPLALMLYAQWRVSSSFKKYSKVGNLAGLSGLQAARRLLDEHGLGNVQVELTKGKLSDHYDPRAKVLRLSPEVANTASVASIGIVAHEVGHAVQDREFYAPLKVRNSLFPVASFGSQFGFILVLVGLFLYGFSLSFGLPVAWAGVALFAVAVIFSLITLPVEFNASSRAMAMLSGGSLVSVRESAGVKAVLGAAALTYVAALLQAVGQLLYFVLMLVGFGRND
ncbi:MULTISPECIES: zinc metallopeptidase [Dehalococcoides]|uniref:Zinc metallopeptidase n=1 Tax=Dehalococcoides mccartyi TaxID=61435 RepID=A0A0V8LY11_9CHLR|nr:zinc metallopeptidase [Dehalococcoides mccartyi]KSV16265.1 zinc metallopeptidase [Dehalococcoides mccartyi]MDN4186310.1 zinc metallopeptidase [Dehalococcoides mccartyi]WRO07317.1 zinc metallopeptidase [Dehalococcoides mccartyi]